MAVIFKTIAPFSALFVLNICLLPMAMMTTACSFPLCAFIIRRAPPNCRPAMKSTALPSSSNGSNNDDDDPAEPSFDMQELQKRMDLQRTQYYDLLMTSDDEDYDTLQPEFVYVIVFNPHDSEEQGVHTIEFPKGSGNNVILAFESDDECVAFAQMLKDMKFYNPVPQMANLVDLQVFCQETGLSIKIVRRGKDLRPPADNVEDLSMNPNLRRDKQRLDSQFMASDNGGDNSTDIENAWE